MRQQTGVMADPVDTIKYYKKLDDWKRILMVYIILDNAIYRYGISSAQEVHMKGTVFSWIWRQLKQRKNFSNTALKTLIDPLHPYR